MREVVEAAPLPVALPCCIDQGQIPRRARPRRLVVGRQVDASSATAISSANPMPTKPPWSQTGIAVVDEPNWPSCAVTTFALANRALRPGARLHLARQRHSYGRPLTACATGFRQTHECALWQRHPRADHALADAAIDAREARATAAAPYGKLGHGYPPRAPRFGRRVYLRQFVRARTAGLLRRSTAGDRARTAAAVSQPPVGRRAWP